MSQNFEALVDAMLTSSNVVSNIEKARIINDPSVDIIDLVNRYVRVNYPFERLCRLYYIPKNGRLGQSSIPKDLGLFEYECNKIADIILPAGVAIEFTGPFNSTFYFIDDETFKKVIHHLNDSINTSLKDKILKKLNS